MTEDGDPWWEHWFGEPYLALYPERDEREARTQAVFAREVLAPFSRAGRLRFLDLGCGTGRRTAALEDGPRRDRRNRRVDPARCGRAAA